MANQVFSVRLWQVLNSTTTGAVLGPVVPAGFRWVVRDVRAINGTLEGSLLFVAQLLIHGGNTIFSTPANMTLGGLMYDWQGRAIVNTGEQLELSLGDPGWTVAVDGYQLTLP
jgi:hypothetical protein